MNSSKKCISCNKKLSLTAFPCRCGGMYCNQHRPDAEHKCTYDYKAEYRNRLSTTMEKVIGKKVDII